MKRTKIVIVGGGSNAWTGGIVKDMFLTQSLSDGEYVLYDINKKAADVMKTYLENVKISVGSNAEIIATDDRAKAFKGANYFIITISTGGLKAMAHDLSIPEKFSIYHTVGDTSGPGGWARGIRNFDVFVKLAMDFNKYAPGAMVLNYTNPMTTLTDVLARLCWGPVVGLCHGLFENLQFIKNYYHMKDERDISVRYAGINHFFWITEAWAGKIDVLADLNKKLAKQSITDMLHEEYMDPMGFKSNRELTTDLFRFTGVMPYIGDRHTCEFFPWYITNKQNLKKYKLVRTSVQDRIKGFNQRVNHYNDLNKHPEKVREEKFNRSRETAADIISSHFEGKVFIDVGNCINTGQISNLPFGAVVETAVQVDRTGFSPINYGDLAEPLCGFIEPFCRTFTLTVDACFQKDKHLAIQALRLDPVCSHLNNDQVMDLGSRLLKAHEKYITCFKV